MANITKLKSGKWRVQIRSHNKYISKTFLKKSNASAWAKEIEYQLDRDQYEDFSDSARISLGDLITPISFGISSKIVIGNLASGKAYHFPFLFLKVLWVTIPCVNKPLKGSLIFT